VQKFDSRSQLSLVQLGDKACKLLRARLVNLVIFFFGVNDGHRHLCVYNFDRLFLHGHISLLKLFLDLVNETDGE